MNALHCVLALCLASAGCTSSAPHRTEAPAPARQAVCPAPPPCPALAPCPEREPPPPIDTAQPTQAAEVWSVVRLLEDLDEDGTPEVIELMSDGHLDIGPHRYFIALHREPDRAHPEWLTVGLEVVDVRRRDGTREVLFWQDGPDDEDPPREHTFFSVRGGQLRASDVVSAPARPEVRGDGIIRFAYEFCPEDGRTARTRVELRMTRAGAIQPTLRRTDYADSDCIMAACPYVYAGSEVLGEILRDLRGASLEAEQGLAIPAELVTPDGTLTLTLRELEAEVTHLDAIHLVADGRVIQPRPCASTELWCEPDGARLTLAIGGELELVFDVGAPARELRLVARGYYEPAQ